jgi:hypothetical protein
MVAEQCNPPDVAGLLALATIGGLPSRAAVLKLRINVRKADNGCAGVQPSRCRDANSPSDDWRAALPGSRVEITN